MLHNAFIINLLFTQIAILQREAYSYKYVGIFLIRHI